MTNREKLAQMSNDELAEFICRQHILCFNCVGRDVCCTNGNGAKTWLDAEAEDEAEDEAEEDNG